MAAFFVLLCIPFSSQTVEAQELHEIFLFKATAETEDGVYHWEYNSPNNFEYHVQGKAFHGDEAKDEVESIYHAANVNKNAKDVELAETFKEHGYDGLSRLDVRWQDKNGDLYTWIWQEEQEGQEEQEE